MLLNFAFRWLCTLANTSGWHIVQGLHIVGFFALLQWCVEKPAQESLVLGKRKANLFINF